MTSSKSCLGSDQLHVIDGKELVILDISHSKLHTPKHTFILFNVFHVPYIKKKSLLSIQKFYIENNIFFNFIHLYFMLRI
jgi:hypothetical protein